MVFPVLLFNRRADRVAWLVSYCVNMFGAVFRMDCEYGLQISLDDPQSSLYIFLLSRSLFAHLTQFLVHNTWYTVLTWAKKYRMSSSCPCMVVVVTPPPLHFLTW